ncbi:hypothetical protein H5410_000069, partial [Solanum commersonii]
SNDQFPRVDLGFAKEKSQQHTPPFRCLFLTKTWKARSSEFLIKMPKLKSILYAFSLERNEGYKHVSIKLE